MRYVVWVCAVVLGFSSLAGAQDKLVLDSQHWEQLAGNWEFKDGEAGIPAAGKESSAIMLKDTNLHDFDFSCEAFAKDAALLIVLRAHFLPDFAKQKKGLRIGAAGLYGGLVMAANDQVALGTFGDAGLDTIEETQGEMKSGDWHTIRVRTEGADWELWIDGTSRGKVTDENFLAGGLALGALPLQEEGDARVAFRNVQLTDLGRVQKWRPLFNGKDLSGWKEWGEEKWTVEDGAIFGRSGEKKSEGYLATEETFKDFDVRGQFKMLGEGNFGLFFHSTITLRVNDAFPVIAGVQGEVEPGYPSSTGWVYESYKRGWLVEPPKNTLAAFALDPKEWNEIRIRSKGNHLTTWVNGVRALDFEDPEPLLTEGSFALQLHTGGVDGITWKELHVAED